MYGIVTKGQTTVVVANLGRIDRANTAAFFQAYMTDDERRAATFSHGRDGSIVATLPDRTLTIEVDADEATYFRAQQLWQCGTLGPGRKPRPTWAEAPAYVARITRATA